MFVAKAIENHVDMFAVAKMHEAERLRHADIKKPILLLGICGDFERASSLEIIATVHDVSQMRELVCKCKKDTHIHIEVDTGMNRFGIRHPWQLKTVLDLAKKNTNIKIDGLYTHFSHEDDTAESRARIDKQLFRFAPFRAIMRRYNPKAIIHAASSGSLGYPPAQFDMVRPGKALYGGWDGYKTAVRLHAKIVSVRTVLPGENVGYGGLFTATKRMQVGVVSCGYAVAGFLAYHTPDLLVGKKRCEILGRVCMDTMFLDVTGIHDPVGKTVTILDDVRGARLSDVAKQTGKSAAIHICSLNPLR